LELKLDLGAGRSPHDGFLAVDKEDYPETDVVHDLDNYPWPFNNAEVGEIICYNVLEHLESPYRAAREIVRICRAGARIDVRFPISEHENATLDDDHKYILTPRWFDLFDEIEIMKCEKHHPSPRLGKLDFLPIDSAQPDEYRLKLEVKEK